MIQQLERKIIELVATDRIFVPISSMKGKLEREKHSNLHKLDKRD